MTRTVQAAAFILLYASGAAAQPSETDIIGSWDCARPDETAPNLALAYAADKTARMTVTDRGRTGAGRFEITLEFDILWDLPANDTITHQPTDVRVLQILADGAPQPTEGFEEALRGRLPNEPEPLTLLDVESARMVIENPRTGGRYVCTRGE